MRTIAAIHPSAYRERPSVRLPLASVRLLAASYRLPLPSVHPPAASYRLLRPSENCRLTDRRISAATCVRSHFYLRTMALGGGTARPTCGCTGKNPVGGRTDGGRRRIEKNVKKG